MHNESSLGLSVRWETRKKERRLYQ